MKGGKGIPSERRLDKVYIACEDLNFDWEPKQVKQFITMWNDGESLETISNYFKRDIDECAILVIDQAREGKLRKRKNGIWGG